MPVVFVEPAPDLGPEPGRRRAPRWLPVVAVVAIGVVGVLVARGQRDDPVASPPATPPPSAAVTFVPTAARGVVVTTGSATVVVVDQYALPGVMTVSGRAGWQFDAAASTAEVRQYTALDLATGMPGPIVTFGIADRAPLATIEAETTRHAEAVTAEGATGLSVVAGSFGTTFASDLSYTDATGRYVMERIWLHDGVTLFVRIVDVDASAVSALFDDTVRFGTVTP